MGCHLFLNSTPFWGSLYRTTTAHLDTLVRNLLPTDPACQSHLHKACLSISAPAVSVVQTITASHRDSSRNFPAGSQRQSLLQATQVSGRPTGKQRPCLPRTSLGSLSASREKVPIARTSSPLTFNLTFNSRPRLV